MSSVKNMKRSLLLLVLFITSIAFANDKETPTPKSLQELEKEIRKVMAENKVPGVSIAIVSRDQPIWFGSLGKADVASNKDVTADTLFRIGSTSKAFVSLSILQLMEQGRIQLEDPVRKWAPEVEFTNRWESTDPVRVVHVLEHTSGFDDIAMREYAHNDPNPIGLREALAYNPKSRVSRWRPGTRMSYCNSGPPVAAYIVEKLTGQKFEEYVEEHLFRPLQMNTASYFLTPDVERSLTRLYRNDGTTPYPYWHILMRPSGSINASAKEMAHYVQMYLNRGRFNGASIVRPSSIDRMEKAVSTYAARMGMAGGYGLSNYTSPYKAFVFHGHNGGVEGGLTEMSYLPDHGLGFVMMMNSGNGVAYTEINNLIRNYLIRDLPKLALPASSSVPADVVVRYSGLYEPISPRIEMLRFIERLLGMSRVKLQGSDLQMKSLFGEINEYLAVNGRIFRKKDSPLSSLALVADDQEGTLIQTMWTTYRKIPASLAIVQIVIIAAILLLMLSSLLFALVWIPRKVFSRMRKVPHLRVRLIPLVSVMCMVGFVLLVATTGEDVMVLGRMTWVSMLIFALTLLFASDGIVGTVCCIAGTRIRAAVRRHSQFARCHSKHDRHCISGLLGNHRPTHMGVECNQAVSQIFMWRNSVYGRNKLIHVTQRTQRLLHFFPIRSIHKRVEVADQSVPVLLQLQHRLLIRQAKRLG